MQSDKDSFKTLTDIELVLEYKSTDNTRFVGILFERYSTFVYAICLKYLQDREKSKDAAMQVFEKLMVDLKKHSVTNFKSWLHSVAKNYCLMQLRKDKGINVIGGEAGELLSPLVEYRQFLHQEEEQLKETKLADLEKALEQLNDEQKKCIDLFYLKEKSYQEIVILTGYNINNVKSFIQNGKRNLKNIITQKNVTK